MKAEAIINAMGNIDEAFIDDCNKLRREYSFGSRTYGKWIAVAACLVIIAAAGMVFISINGHRPGKNPSSEYVNIPYGSQTPYTEQLQENIVAVKPTDTPVPTAQATPLPTARATLLPTETPVITAGPTEIVPTATEESKDWGETGISFLAMMEPDYGDGYKEDGILNRPACDGAAINPTYEYILRNSEWSYDFYLGEGLYKARASALSKEDIGQYIGEADVNINEENVLKTTFTKRLPMYSVKGLNSDIFVAIKISEEEYYLFRNVRYGSAGISEFITDYDLRNKVVIKTSALKSAGGADYTDERAVDDAEAIWDALANAEHQQEFISDIDSESCERICFVTDSEFYGFYNMPITIYENGNVCIIYFRHSYQFNIGEEGYKQIYDLTRGD